MPFADGTRYRALDGYRAVAALLVMLHHYDMDFRLGLAGWSPAVPRLHLLVDFFFILSGFVVAARYGDRLGSGREVRDFLVRRIARLYPLHLLTLAGYLALALVAATGWVRANHAEHLALSALPANLLLVQAWGVVPHPSFNVPAWSISAEWFLYLLLPLALPAVRRLPAVAVLAAIAGLALGFAALRGACGLAPWTHATHDLGALRALPSFLAGILVATRLPALSAGRPLPWPLVHALALAALLLLHLGAPDEAVLAVFVALVAGAASAERGRPDTILASGPAQRLGAASYAIYMVHMLAAVPVLFVLRRIGEPGTAGAVAAAALTAAAVVVLADILHRRFERPWQDRINGLAGGRPAREALA